MTGTRRMLVALLRLALLFAIESAAAAGQSRSTCSLANIDISEGMSRTDLEARLAKVSGRTSTVSPYANNLAGGTVEYRDGQCVLTVVYRAGAPAPLVRAGPGRVAHLSPKDETVITHRIRVDPTPGNRVDRGGAK